jgi:hypothetical protein
MYEKSYKMTLQPKETAVGDQLYEYVAPVLWRLKAGIVEPERTTVSSKRLGKRGDSFDL